MKNYRSYRQPPVNRVRQTASSRRWRPGRHTFRQRALTTALRVTPWVAILAGLSIVPSASGQTVSDYPGPRARDVALGAEAVRRLLAAPSIRFRSPAMDEEWVEGAPVTITWVATGPICWARVYYYGGKCELGGQSRGSFSGYVTETVAVANSVQWTVPWIDASSFRLRIAGLGANGERLASCERTVRFRPRELVGLPDTCIAIIKRKQRLYYYRDGRVVRLHIISTARQSYTTPTMKPGDYSRRRGAMGQVFCKAQWPRSRRYDVVMPYWLAVTSTGSHGIHGTSPNLYYRLGQPASHGCIRQHRDDARALFETVAVGTPVHIF